MKISQLQMSMQIGNGSSANYVQLAPKTVSASDGWIQFEGTYRYNNVSSEYLTLYVEISSNSTASFYIDDISFEKTGSGPVGIQKDLTPIKDAYLNDFLIGILSSITTIITKIIRIKRRPSTVWSKKLMISMR
ncbi:hypothetical protein MHH52_07350 [Paenibacillus sp. FSL K6-0276]|uniref:hypothetical protein n=1 Tax=Paenibacillus sp. FSL K6-0276 TaxID=2921450 RepID=UPI0030ED42AD